MTSQSMINVLLLGVISYAILDSAMGHGRMIEPAARNTMWRFNYKNPRNYNDMGLNCGGFPNQFERQGGRCGVCGDPFQGPRDNEAGGKYARGLIARQYRVGSFINITVELTSNHKGYMEFRLCPVNNPRVKATQTCLDRNLLNIIGHGTRYFITQNGGNVFIELMVMLPPRLECSQCVIQWKWVAGQSMGPDGYGGECMGCGNQEHFVNCADIAIGTKAVTPLPKLPETVSKPMQPPPHVAHPGPEYSVAGSQSNSVNYVPSQVVTKGPANNPAANVAPKRQATTQSPWKMDPNTMYQSLMAGAFGQTDVILTTSDPWNNAWQQQQPQNVPAQMAYFQDPSMSSMFGMLPNFFRESNEWSPDAPTHNQHHQQRAPPAPQPHEPGHDPADYAGNEPGEYPEIESPSQGPSPPSGASSGSSSYMQGYNDALKQMQQGFGLSGDWNNFNPKASRAVSEITLSLQEKQKQQNSNPNCPGRICKATGSWKGQSNLDTWCETTCKVGQCPGHMCACTCPGLGGW